MDLSSLLAFVQVAKDHSFSVAAEHLFITQPAVSKRVSSLEMELDCPLFDRIGKKIQLTPIGSALLPKAIKLLEDADNIKKINTYFSKNISGKLLIGTSHHIGLHRLPPYIQSFTEQYPEVNLDLRFLDSEDACRQVESGELEMAIVTLPEDKPPQLTLTKIWHDELVILVNHHHPLTKIKNISLETLAEYPAVLPGSSTYTRLILNNALMGKGLKLNIAMSTNYLETLKMLVSTGQGWSLLPKSMKDENTVEIKTPLKVARSLGIVVHKKRSLSNASKALIENLKHY